MANLVTTGRPLLIASSNPHKLDEIRAVLDGFGIRCAGLDDLDADHPEPVEDGETFADNARIKAETYARMTGRPCLADDSGLEIDALSGLPGVRSARYAGSHVPADADRATRDAANNELVLAELGETAASERTARFVCALCVATPDGQILAEVRGTFEGRIGSSGENGVPRGQNGFGYDPLFLVAPDFTRTSAELSPREKNAISHRGRALSLLADRIRDGAFNAFA